MEQPQVNNLNTLIQNPTRSAEIAYGLPIIENQYACSSIQEQLVIQSMDRIH